VRRSWKLDRVDSFDVLPDRSQIRRSYFTSANALVSKYLLEIYYRAILKFNERTRSCFKFVAHLAMTRVGVNLGMCMRTHRGGERGCGRVQQTLDLSSDLSDALTGCDGANLR